MAAMLRKSVTRAPHWMAVAGPSMGALYRDGAALLVAPRGRPPRVGEVWVFCADDGEVYAHRVVARRRGAVVFAGDTNDFDDPPVAPVQLVGHAVAVLHDRTVRRLGRATGIAPVLRAWRRRLPA